MRIVRPQLLTHPKADQEHDKEVDDERDCYLDHIQGKPHDQITLEREHDENREQQRDEGQRADARNKAGPIAHASELACSVTSESRHHSQRTTPYTSCSGLCDWCASAIVACRQGRCTNRFPVHNGSRYDQIRYRLPDC